VPICCSPCCQRTWALDVVELPWPGEKRYRHEGWEHVEVVLRGDHQPLIIA
jgi:predicted metalloenzyme YecM